MADSSTWGKAKEALQAVASVKNFREVMRGFWGVFVWAAICDGFSSIPYVGLIFSGIGYGTIWLTLEIKGVDASIFGDTKRMASFGAEWIAGALGLSVVPGISVWTYFCIADHKAEVADKQKKEQQKELAKMEKSMRETQKNLAKDAVKNQEGGRQAGKKKGRSKTSAYM